jgi:hypothetical protein
MFQFNIQSFQYNIETFQFLIEIDRFLNYNYRCTRVTEHIKYRRVYYMSVQRADKNQTTAKKDLIEKLNSYAVEINRYLQSKEQFLTAAVKFGSNMTGKDRRRLFGAGVKNYGFIEMAYDVARENPDFMPPHLNLENLQEGLRNFENMRQLVFELEQYLQAANNVMLLESDSHYRNSLRIYGSLQEQSRNRVEGAQPLFKALQTFFHRRKRGRGELTEKELLRDAKKLLHGKADGEIVIKNESPDVTGGKRKVIDNVRKGKTKIKETAEGSAD